MTTRMIKNKKIQLEEKKRRKTIKKEKRNKVLKKILVWLILIISLLLIYSLFIETNMLKVNEYKITTDKITQSFHGLKIVQFSDLHYGTSINKNNIDNIINKINYLKPDIVVFTGDLIDSKTNLTKNDKEQLTNKLKTITATLGKYAVIGNHDINNKNYDNILFDADFKILKNDLDLIYYKDNTPILIYGVDDYLLGEPKLDKLDKKYDNLFKILLVHEPDYIKKIDNNFDIILTGHSHGGQINIPFINKPLYLPNGSKTYYKNYYKINDTELFVSNGIGTSIVPMRFNSIPSINLFRITKK